MKINVNITGIDELTKNIEGMAGQKALDNADKITETYTRKMANVAGENAPVKDNVLRPSIIASPRRIQLGTWEFGSTLPYARRQEYEHSTRKGFIRKSVWNNRTPYRNAIRKEFSRWK